MDAFDSLPFGVVLLDGTASILSLNRAAQRILDGKDGLSLDRGALTAADPAIAALLRKAIHSAAATGNGRGFDPGRWIACPRPSLKRPLALLVAPLGSGRVDFDEHRAAVAVFVSDPEHARELPHEWLRRWFQLTPREAALASRLAAGDTIGMAAEALSVTVQTARTQLKGVFRKTETSRQSQLVRLLAATPPLHDVR